MFTFQIRAADWLKPMQPADRRKERQSVMRFSPKDFQVPETQRDILLNGTREDLIQWLRWNDRNGAWSDDDSAAEGWRSITLEQARACMRNALEGSPCDLKTADSKSIDFDPHLPANADEAGCKAWLRQLCRGFGAGLHLDTPVSDSLKSVRLPLSAEVEAMLVDSIRRAFEILGDDGLSIVCAEIADVMVASFLDRLAREHTEEKPRGE